MLFNLQYPSLEDIKFKDDQNEFIGLVRDAKSGRSNWGYKLVQTMPHNPTSLEKVLTKLGIVNIPKSVVLVSDFVPGQNIAEQLIENAETFKIMYGKSERTHFVRDDSEGLFYEHKPNVFYGGGAPASLLDVNETDIFSVVNIDSGEAIPDNLPEKTYVVVNGKNTKKGMFLS